MPQVSKRFLDKKLEARILDVFYSTLARMKDKTHVAESAKIFTAFPKNKKSIDRWAEQKKRKGPL